MGPGGARTGGTGATGATVPGGGATGGAGAGGAAGVGATGGTRAGAAVSAGGPAGAGAAGGPGSGGATRPRPYFVLLLEQVLGLPPSSSPAPSLECPPPVQSESQLQLASPLPAPSPYANPTGGLAERREPESHPASPVRTARTSRRVPRPRPHAVPGTHQMALRPSTAPQRVPLPSPPESSLPALADPTSDSLRAASPTVTRFLATVVTDPSFESTAASALVSELVDIAAHCRLDYAASLVAESASVCPPSVGGECALSTDVLEDRQEEFQCFAAALPHLMSTLLAPEGDPDAPDIPTPRSYVEAIEGPYSSQWQAAMDAEMASWKSTGTYVDEVPPPGANIVSGMWIFRVKRPLGSPPVFKARYVARGFSQRHGGSLHEEIWLRRPPGFTGSFPPGTQWSLRRPVYGLRQAPREWHDTLRTTLAALGFAPSIADPSLFLRTDTLLPPVYILVHVDDLVFSTAYTAGLAHVKSELQKRHTCTDLEPSGPYPELVGCLMYLMTCTRPDLAYPLSILARYVAPGRHRLEHMVAAKRVLRYLCSTSGLGLVLGGRNPVVLTSHTDASWVDDLATQRSSQGYTFSLGSGSVSWRSTRSSSVLSSSCEVEIYAGAMAAQELRWLTYLLTDLGELPRSPPVLYVDNKAMLALCREHRLEHRTKHIALRYFLARDLQQHGQLRLAYVASQANSADIFTKALQPCDHQRFCTMLACFALLCLTVHSFLLILTAGAGGAAGVGAVGAGAVPTGGAAGAAAVGGPGAGGAVGVVVGDPGAEGIGAVSSVSGGIVRPRPPPTRGLTERRERESRLASPKSRPESPVFPVRTGRRVPHQRPSTAPQRVPLPSPPASSLPALADPESDSLRTASHTVTHLLATVVTDPSFESTAAPALVAELVDFAAHCRQDYAASLVGESESASVCPLSVEGECALGTDVLEERQGDFECFAAAVAHLVSMLLAPEGDPDAPDIPTPRSYAKAIEGPYSSQWQAAMDAEMASWKSTGTYVDEVPPPWANIVSGMWIFRVKRPPGSPPVFKARYVARGFSQRHGVDFFQTFSPTPKMTTLRVLLHVAAQRDYELHSLDFSTAFLQGSLHEEIWLRRPPGFTGSFPAGTQWSLQRPVYGLRQAPREWHDTLRTTLAALVLVYLDDLVFATADTEALAHVKLELQKKHTSTDLSKLTSYLGLRITRDRAQRTIILTHSHMVQPVRRAWGSCLEDGLELSSLVTETLPGSSCEAEIYAGAMAAQELRWLTYLLTDLGEAPRSPPVLYVDNKAMLALCQEN
ncbi:unnamed protein product [Closterium sp. NIES-53]